MNKQNASAARTADVAMPTSKAAISLGCMGDQFAKQTASPRFIYKKIGNTKYRVAVHFSDTSGERMEDKMLLFSATQKKPKEFGNKQ